MQMLLQGQVVNDRERERERERAGVQTPRSRSGASRIVEQVATGTSRIGERDWDLHSGAFGGGTEVDRAIGRAAARGRGVSFLSRRGCLGGDASGKDMSASQSSSSGGRTVDSLGLVCRDASDELLTELRSLEDDDTDETEPRLRGPMDAPRTDIRFMSDGGVGAGRIGIWKCRACGAETLGFCFARQLRGRGVARGEDAGETIIKAVVGGSVLDVSVSAEFQAVAIGLNGLRERRERVYAAVVEAGLSQSTAKGGQAGCRSE